MRYWSAYIIGSPDHQRGSTKFVVPFDQDPPNAFHRLMHRLLLGIRWYEEGK